ncbi:LysR family transcriptional regulator [Bordetella avium]|uniref:LysR family transcriptional regulator n=1 Tax=Bordetella avium TaxID=521 RepID=UPI0030B86847
MHSLPLEHLADLKMLTVLADTRSFTAAAQRLGVSKSLISLRMKALEQALGVSLLLRTTRSVRPTEAGALLIDRSRPALDTLEASFGEVRNLTRAPRGRLRLTAPVALGRQHLGPLLARLGHAYPDIALEVYLSDRFVNLRQEGYDFALRHADQVSDAYVSKRLCATRAYLVASPEYLARQGRPTHPSELSRHRCLLYRGDERNPQWSFSPRHGRGAAVHVKPTGSLTINNSELLRESAGNGLGIAMVPDFSLGGELEAVLPDWDCYAGFGRSLYLLKPFSATPTEAHRLVEQALIDYFRPGPAGAQASKDSPWDWAASSSSMVTPGKPQA